MGIKNLTKEQIIDGINNDTVSFTDLPDQWKDNKDIVLLAIKKNPELLEYASERLRGDKELVLDVIKFDGYLLSVVSKNLKDNKDIVLEAVKQSGWSLYYASERLKDDKEVILEAVIKDGEALFYASDKLQQDKELLEILEREPISNYGRDKLVNWYKERMEVLANIRRQEDKEFMENSIIASNLSNKKIKF